MHTPSTIYEIVKNLSENEDFEYYRGIIALDRRDGRNAEQGFERLTAFVRMLDDLGLAFAFSRRLGEMEYSYLVRKRKDWPPKLADVADEFTVRPRLEEWFVDAKKAQLMMAMKR